MRDNVAKSIVDEWNKQWPTGTPVWRIDDLGNRHQTFTTSHAWVIGIGDNAETLVGVNGTAGGYLLERIVPINLGFVDPAIEQQ